MDSIDTFDIDAIGPVTLTPTLAGWVITVALAGDMIKGDVPLTVVVKGEPAAASAVTRLMSLAGKTFYEAKIVARDIMAEERRAVVP